MSAGDHTALVLGASGDQGWPQVQRLAAAGFAVRAATRSAATLARKTPSHATIVTVDYEQPATLAAAVAGVDVVLANYPSSSFHDPGALITAAEHLGRYAAEAGVSLIVFNTSLPLPPRPLGFAAQDVRFAQRSALRRHGVPVVSIQPAVYMDNLLRRWAYPEIVERARLYYPLSAELEVSWICHDDLATLMVAAAQRPQLGGRDIAVGGPQALRGPEVAAILSEVIGRRIAFVSQPIDEFAARMEERLDGAATLDSQRLARELARVYRWYNDAPERPFRVHMAPVLADLPVRLTTFRNWAVRQRWDGERR